MWAPLKGRKQLLRFSTLLTSRGQLLKQTTRDPKHVFTNSSNNEVLDPKHFFTNPDQNSLTPDEVIAQSIQASIKNQRRRRTRQISSALFVALFGVVFGYSIGYKVLYLREESFIPLYPVAKTRSFTDSELKQINLDEIKRLAEYRVLEKLSMHPMIKEEYGVPLHKTQAFPLKVRELSVWRKDPNPCVAGFVIAPYKSPSDQYTWHTVPFICKWRMMNRPLVFKGLADKILGRVNIDTSELYQVVHPEQDRGDLVFERPPHHSEDPRSMHIYFLGEIELGENSSIIFKGKYHIDVRLQQVDLLRRENDTLVRYVLYQENEN